jgi:hypothetical protein
VLNEKLAVAYSKYLEELAKLEEEEARKNKKDDVSRVSVKRQF